jgi:hypothetical protein
MYASKTLFLTFALFCYITPFIFPPLFFLIFIFPSFLYIAFQFHLSFFTIVAWSCAATILHLMPLCDALINMASGPWYLRLAPALLLIIYVTSYITLWLYVTYKVMHFINIWPLQLMLWTGSFWLYYMATDYLLLWPFGHREGYLFMNPLLPLATKPQLLFLISILPYPLVFAIFCCFTTLITTTCYHPKMAGLVLIIVTLLWCNRVIISSTSAKWLSTIGHLPLIVPASIDIYTGALIIRHELDQISKHYPQITTIIMPESAWHGIKLSHLSHLPWDQHSIGQVIIGGFADDKNSWTNRLYCFKNGLIHYYFDKRHAVPVTERALEDFPLNKALFFEKSPPIMASSNERLPLDITNTDCCIPYLCSELFCNNWPDDSFNKIPILALVNDWWFRMPHFQRLMAYAAQFQAMKWQRPILYISYYYAYFFNSNGYAMPLPTNNHTI